MSGGLPLYVLTVLQMSSYWALSLLTCPTVSQASPSPDLTVVQLSEVGTLKQDLSYRSVKVKKEER